MTATKTFESKLDAVLAAGDQTAAQSPAWLAEKRRLALDAFRATGVPTMKDEEWKYTSLRTVAETEWSPAEPGPAWFGDELPRLAKGSARVVVVNGQLDRNQSEFDAGKGVRIESLRDALVQGPVDQFGDVSRPGSHPFAALNTATFTDGVLVRVSAMAEADRPVEILHVTSGDGQVVAPRVLIVVEKGARVQVVEHYVSHGDATNLTIPVTEVSVAENAQVEHVRVQDEAPTGHHIGMWATHQAQDSTYESYNIAFGGALARLDQDIWIGGRHTTTRLDGVVLARGGQVIDNHTRLDHALPDGTSFEIYKQIVDDRATVVFNGKIFVHQDAQKTDAKQTNQALLLSPQATINSKPQLEIFADDVKCTHGATVGQLEDDPLFYMRSRGIPQKQAEAVLVYAFAAEVLELITLADVRESLEKTLFARLAEGRAELGQQD